LAWRLTSGDCRFLVHVLTRTRRAVPPVWVDATLVRPREESPASVAAHRLLHPPVAVDYPLEGASDRALASVVRAFDPVTLHEAASILGCSPRTIERHVLAGLLVRHRGRYRHQALSRAGVEALAREIYPWRKFVHLEGTYWVTGTDAAAVIG